ncbi:MAG: alpha-mannosidase, partial [bacterium]
MEKNEHALKRLEFRLYELTTFKLLKRTDINSWLFSDNNKDWQEIHLGEKWPKQGFPCYFKKEFHLSDEWKGLPVLLQLWVDGEGIVYINNKPVGGLDPNHREFELLEMAQGGEHFQVFIEAVPRGPFGSHLGENRFSQASIAAIDKEVESSLFDLLAVLDAAKNLSDESELKGFLIKALDDALSSVKFLSNTQEYLRIAGENPFAQKMIFRIWNPPIPQLQEIVNPEEVRASIVKAKEKLSQLIEEIKKKYPHVGNITLTGHSHIDLAWLWPMAETRRKIRRTTSTVLSLMERYPEFKYNQSSAQVYAFLKEDEPELYERVKEKVRSGMWEPIGGMWVESDCNLTSGESLVRQTLYAQKFFEKEFGKRCKVAWLPDAFGFTWTLPQILKKAGLEYFLTTKINWNETNKFPYDLFYWQSLDGTRVIAHSFLNPGQGYNGNIRALDLLGTWQNYREKTIYYNTLLSFGYGDGGGGPTLEMLEMYKRFKDFPGYPSLKMGIVEEYFENAPKEGLPLWDGELYLELHRGTYTTQSRMKKANRLAEHLLYTVETISTVAYLLNGKYPQKEVTYNWQKVLRNQFHDILPGSSIKEVYEDALKELKEVEEFSRKTIEDTLKDVASEISLDREGLVIFNPNSFPRTLCYIGDIPYSSLELPDGRTIKVQRLYNGKGLVYSPYIDVPPVGYLVLYKSDKDEEEKKLTVNTTLLENERVKVKIGEDGSILSFFDKVAQRDIFTAKGNQLWAYSDRPRDWDAWDVSPDYERYGEEIKDVEYINVVENGVSRGVVEVKKRYRDSYILQRYILYRDNPRLDIETEIDWHER